MELAQQCERRGQGAFPPIEPDETSEETLPFDGDSDARALELRLTKGQLERYRAEATTLQMERAALLSMIATLNAQVGTCAASSQKEREHADAVDGHCDDPNVINSRGSCSPVVANPEDSSPENPDMGASKL